MSEGWDVPVPVGISEIAEYGSTAIDRVAYRVTRPGEHWDQSNKQISCLTFDAPPPMRSTKRRYREMRPENLAGRRIGRLTVVGYWGRAGEGNEGSISQKWVCRCDCGLYVVRTGKTIKAARDPDDKCEYCRHLAFVKRSYEYHKERAK